jgi:hypothetical protein
MSDETNVAVATEAPIALKSNDTSSKAKEAIVETTKTPEPKVVAKVEAKAEADVKPPEGESDAPDADSPQGKTEKRLPRWMKERLERERQVTEARTRATVLQEIQERQPVKPESLAPQSHEKTMADFDFDQDKYIAYRVERALEVKDQTAKAEADRRKQAEAQESFKSHVDAFEEKAGDGAWDDIVSSALNTDPSYKGLTELFMGDEHDLEIAHHLATNMDEAKRIKALPRLSQVREIAKLAEQFDGVKEAKPAVLPKKTTSAPPPVKTISGAGKPSVDINDPGMSTADRIKAWKAGKR